jgi:hypothetical protein
MLTEDLPVDLIDLCRAFRIASELRSRSDREFMATLREFRNSGEIGRESPTF